MGTLRPKLTRRLRWVLLLAVPLIVIAIVVHSALVAPPVGLVLMLAVAWAWKARDAE